MKKKFIPAAILLVVGMFIFSEYTGEKEIIFPEISALALGAWVMEKSPWGNSRLHLWLSPTLAAMTGFAIVKVLPYSPFFMIAGAFILVVLQLKLMGSGVLPSISAAILPILTKAESWYYPLSVCILTAIIVCGRTLIDRFHRKNDTTGLLSGDIKENKETDRLQEELLYWAKLLAGILIVSAVALYFHWTYMIAPPLIVVLVELSKPNGPLRSKVSLVFALLVLAAFSGVLWLYLIYYFLHWPVWISACLAVAWVFLLFYYIRLPFPPAAAITLLPTIVPVKNLWMYPWQVLLGSAVFLLISILCFKKQPVITN